VTRSPRIVSHAHARALACVIDDFGLKCSDVSCPQRHLRLMKRKLQDFFMRISFHSPPHALSLFLTTTHPRKRKKFAHEKKLNLQGNLPTVEGQEEVRRFIVFFHPIFSIFLPFHFSRSEVFLVEKRRRTREEKRRTRLCECRKTSE
jgi:hypothetical protein